MDTRDLPDVAMEDHVLMPDIPACDDVEDAPAIALHPLSVAMRQLEILQNQVFLAGPISNIQAPSNDNNTPRTGDDSGPYCRLACDVLSCTVSACELWRESLLRHPAPSTASCPQISTAELYRLLSKLMTSMHILDCLKDSKQALRVALSAVTAQEGDEQQLLTAVQDFFNMPTACLVLLRDMLLEQPEALSQTKTALFKLLEFQLAAVDGVGGHEGERKWGSLKSKLGLTSGATGDGSPEVNLATRSSGRIALSLIVHLYCCVESVEQEHLASQPLSADGNTGVTVKSHAMASQKLRACVATLRAMPIVPGYGDVFVDLLRPLQGCSQLSVPWESNALVDMATLEERYCLSMMSSGAAIEYGRTVEDLLALKLQYESDKQRLAEDGRTSSAGGSSGATDLRSSAPDVSSSCRLGTSQAALSRAVGALAGRAVQLLQDWQAAVLHLDAFRTWQHRQPQEEAQDAAEGVDAEEQHQAKPRPSRCVFTPSDMPDVVRMVSYIKGLHGALTENITWMEPLLRLHCAAHLAQLLTSVVLPVASGVLGLPQPPPPPSVSVTTAGANLPQRPPLPPLAKVSAEAHLLSVPTSARGNVPSVVPTVPVMTGITAEGSDAYAEGAINLATGIGRVWKGRALRHGRTRSTVSSLEVNAPTEFRQPIGMVPFLPEGTITVGPSQRTTEESADTVNLLASITADNIDWALARPGGEYRNDPYARLREWFAAGGVNPGGAPVITCLNTPLEPVPECQTLRESAEHFPIFTVASDAQCGRAIMTAKATSFAPGCPPSTQREPGGSGARLAITVTGTEGTEDGVECTVSSVSDCEGLTAGLESEEPCGSAIPEDHSRTLVAEPLNEDGANAITGILAQSLTPSKGHGQQSYTTDLPWPQPPVPSASWLGGNAGSPAQALVASAGGASSAVAASKTPPSGAPRVTAPSALSTNPLYIYPSAAREAVAEQERATVAIWIASEGGSMAPPLYVAQEGSSLAATGAEPAGANPEEGGTPVAGHSMQLHNLQQQAQEISEIHMSYCDDLGATPRLDSGVRQHSCYEGSNVRLGMTRHDDMPGGYCDELQLSHSQMEVAYLPQPDYSDIPASCDGMGLSMNFDYTAPAVVHPPAPRKSALSPFKHIKKLFSKRSAFSGDKTSVAPRPPSSTQFDDTVIGPRASDTTLDAIYGGADYSGTTAGFGALPAPYLVDSREMATSAEIESSALLGMQGANTCGAYCVGLIGHHPPTLSGEFLPGIVEEAAARDGAVAVLSIGPSGQVLGGQTEQQASGDTADTNAAGGRAGGKPRPSAGGGGTVKGGAAAFMEVAARAREEQRCERLLAIANDMQVSLSNAGFHAGSERTSAPTALTPAQHMFRAARKSGPAGGARASLKRLVTSIKGRSVRNRSGGGASTSADQDVHTLACDAAQGMGLDARGYARLRNSAELMADELARWLNQRRERGKSTKDGPSTMQLLAMSSELRSFLAIGLPTLEPLLAFSSGIAAAADLSSLLLLDPSRSYGGSQGSGLTLDARGSVPWELANKGVLINSVLDSGTGKLVELPLSSGLTVLTLFKDAIDALQMQQAQAIASGYPEPPTAGRMQLMYRLQTRWCVGTFIQMAARKVWGTYKAQAMRFKLGLVISSGVPDIALSTAAFQGLFRSPREETDPQHVLFLLANARPDQSMDSDYTLNDQMAGAINDLIRQSACRVANLLLGSDLTSLVAVKQQLDVLAAAVTRLRQELPSIRPWKDTWLAALAARAASSTTCATISEAAAATAAAVSQGCDSGAAGVSLVSADDIILTHACSVAALRTLSTWSYDMSAVKFRPTKHTKNIWDGLVGAAPVESVSPRFPDGADIALASVAVDAGSSGRQGSHGTDTNTAFFNRTHVQAMHGLLGLTGVGRWVAALRQHAVDLLADAAPLLRRVHELYDTSLAGPRGPSMRESGGPSGYLHLQQRWLRDRGHSELLVSANRAMQALGNTVAAIALTDSVMAELCVSRAPHMLPLAASALQADQQAHAALKSMASVDAGVPSGMVKNVPPISVPPPPKGSGLAGLLLGHPVPPGLMSASQTAVQAASIVQDRLQEQLPAAFGLPGLWRALHECLYPSLPARPEPLLSASRLWSVVQVQLSCLTPEEQVVHTANVGDGVYVSAASLVQLAAGAAIVPGSVLHGGTMTQLQQAVTLEQLKVELFNTTAEMSTLVEKATLDQLKAWSVRAEMVRSAWDRAVQLTVGAGATAAKLSVLRSARPELSASQVPKALDTPALVSCSNEPWTLLAQQAAIAATAVLARAAAAATSTHAQTAQQNANAPSHGAAVSRGQAPSQGRPPSQPGLVHSIPPRNAPPRPPASTGFPQPQSMTGSAALQRNSLNGPPLPPRVSVPAPAGRSTVGHIQDGTLSQQAQALNPPPQQQQQPLQHIRAASQVLMKSPREGTPLGAHGLFTMAGSTAAQSRSRAASSLGDFGQMESS